MLCPSLWRGIWIYGLRSAEQILLFAANFMMYVKKNSNQTAFYWNRWLAKIILIGRSFSKDWMVYSWSYFLYFLGYNLLEIMTSKYCSIPWNMSNVSTLKPLQIFYDFKFPVLALFLAFLLDFNFIRNDHISDHISQCPMLLALLISLSIPTPTFWVEPNAPDKA